MTTCDADNGASEAQLQWAANWIMWDYIRRTRPWWKETLAKMEAWLIENKG